MADNKSNRGSTMKWMIFLFLFLNAFPVGMHAGIAVTQDADHTTKWASFNNVVESKTKEIKAIVFGPVIKVLGMLGIAYGVCMLVMGQTKQMVTFAGIGLLLNIIPHFIDTIFGAMLPR